MTQSVFCQIIPTKEQQIRISELTTPERLIEYSKGLSNELLQRVKIDSLISEISKRDLKIFSLILEHRNTLVRINLANNQIDVIDTSIEILETESEDSFFKDKLHLYVSSETPYFNFNKTVISSSLMIDFKYFELGLTGNALPMDNKLNFNYSLKLRYKIF